MRNAILSTLCGLAAATAIAGTALAEDPRAGHCGPDRYWEEGAQACLDARNAPGNRAVVVEREAPVVVTERDTATGHTQTTVITPVEVKRY